MSSTDTHIIVKLVLVPVVATLFTVGVAFVYVSFVNPDMLYQLFTETALTDTLFEFSQRITSFIASFL